MNPSQVGKKSYPQRTREAAEENARLRRAVMALREALVGASTTRSFNGHLVCRICDATLENEPHHEACPTRKILAEHNV